MKFAVELAEDIMAMADEIVALRAEVHELREYRRKYDESVQQSIDHNQQMIGGLFAIAMTPGVMDALAKANQND